MSLPSMQMVISEYSLLFNILSKSFRKGVNSRLRDSQSVTDSSSIGRLTWAAAETTCNFFCFLLWVTLLGFSDFWWTGSSLDSSSDEDAVLLYTKSITLALNKNSLNICSIYPSIRLTTLDSALSFMSMMIPFFITSWYISLLRMRTRPSGRNITPSRFSFLFFWLFLVYVDLLYGVSESWDSKQSGPGSNESVTAERGTSDCKKFGSPGKLRNPIAFFSLFLFREALLVNEFVIKFLNSCKEDKDKNCLSHLSSSSGSW